MEYSELVNALQQEDDAKVNSLLKDLSPRLVKYLQINMGSTKADAEDCVQQAFVYAIEAIRKEKIRDPEKILSYLLQICKNNYLKKIKDERKHESAVKSTVNSPLQDPGQLKRLLSKERFEILEECLEELNEEHREFINYWFRYPGVESKDMADYFEITVTNLWTRKHRIINSLSDCYRKKINL